MLVVAVFLAWVPSASGEVVPHWEGDGERTIYVENDLPSDWDIPLRNAVADWNRSSYIHLVLVDGDETCYDFDYQVEFCWSRYTPTPTWIGLTSTWTYEDGHLRYAVSEANAGKSWGNGKRRFVACHELGHAIGILAHSTATSGSGCMVARFAYVTVYPARPSAADYTTLSEVYAHAG